MRPRLFVTAVLLVTGALLAGPPPATACDCVSVHEAEHWADADLVFLGRAGPRQLDGASLVQEIRVLHLLKGEAAEIFRLVRPMDHADDCDRQLLPDEVALILVRGGSVSQCTGNEPLPTQLRDLPYYLEAAGATETPPVALANVLIHSELGGGEALEVLFARSHGGLHLVVLARGEARETLLALETDDRLEILGVWPWGLE